MKATIILTDSSTSSVEYSGKTMRDLLNDLNEHQFVLFDVKTETDNPRIYGRTTALFNRNLVASVVEGWTVE